ncbi:MAG: HAD family hydrolase [Emcibacter sp.]|nr:HAD family hydrolase [Emcibacter sp.]
MTIELIIFDCDGVLVDSESIANEELRQALVECGLNLTINQVVEKFVGLSMSSVVKIAEDMLGHKLPYDFLEKLQVKTFAAFEHTLRPVQGVTDVLDALSRQQRKICVASSGSPEKMDFTLGLTHLKHYFNGNIFSASQVKRGKPYPDLFLYVANQMNVDPSQCLVIEDSLPGVQGAVAAGMEVLAYATRGQGKKLAIAGGIVFSNMKDILDHTD